ncbi:MAG: hypothetical protein C0605_13720 [Hyphomicrobiales bacterium]|mgnify:CR=1 FL=1|nr:MAG: hypothetical protein C0605_13720 [Hyphomicrobiales bacterium]
MSSADKLAKLKVNAGGPQPELANVTSLRRRKQPQALRQVNLVKKGIQLPPESARQFELLRAEQGRKGYDLWTEAVDLLLQAHGKPPVGSDSGSSS